MFDEIDNPKWDYPDYDDTPEDEDVLAESMTEYDCEGLFAPMTTEEAEHREWSEQEWVNAWNNDKL